MKFHSAGARSCGDLTFIIYALSTMLVFISLAAGAKFMFSLVVQDKKLEAVDTTLLCAAWQSQ